MLIIFEFLGVFKKNGYLRERNYATPPGYYSEGNRQRQIKSLRKFDTKFFKVLRHYLGVDFLEMLKSGAEPESFQESIKDVLDKLQRMKKDDRWQFFVEKINSIS